MNVARSKYDAAQFVFTRRSRGGLTLTTHYTLAHATEVRRTLWDFSIEESGDTPNFDVRHRWVLTTNYQLPWGSSLTGVAHGFLAAWQVNATIYLQSGVAYAITNAASRTNTGGTDRPDPERRSESAGQRAHDSALVRYVDVLGRSAVSGGESRAVDSARPGTAADGFLPFQGSESGHEPAAAAPRRDLQSDQYAEFRASRRAVRQHGFGSISSTGNSIPRQMQFGVKYLF